MGSRARGALTLSDDATARGSRLYLLLRAVGAFCLNLFGALVGTLLIEAPLEHVVLGSSLRTSLFRLDILNSVCAFALGCFAFRKWRSASSKWVWVAGLCWFCQRLVLSPDGSHVVLWEIAATRSVLFVDRAAIANWVFYTVFSLRAVFYSAGAWSAAVGGDLWARRARAEGTGESRRTFGDGGVPRSTGSDGWRG